MFEVMDQLYFACALVFWGKSMARTAWNTLNLSRSFKTQISAQILENCHPCKTKVCTGLQKTHQSDCKILLICLHRVPCGWEISFSNRSNVLGRSLEMSLQHKGSKIKMVCQTKVCTEILETHPADCKILLACVHSVSWCWKIRISDRSSATGGSNQLPLWDKVTRISVDFAVEMPDFVQLLRIRGCNSVYRTKKAANWSEMTFWNDSEANRSHWNDRICAESAQILSFLWDRFASESF